MVEMPEVETASTLPPVLFSMSNRSVPKGVALSLMTSVPAPELVSKVIWGEVDES